MQLGREVTNLHLSRTSLERVATEGDSPVDEKVVGFLGSSPKYCGTRGIPQESVPTTA